MCIYDHLFYHTYKAMSNRKNSFNDMPLFASLGLGVFPVFMFNVISIELLLKGLGVIHELLPLNTYIPIIILFCIFYFYYSFRGHYKKIIERYDSKQEPSYAHSVLISLSYVFVSAFVMIVAGVFS